MKCEEIRDLILEYPDGYLTRDEKLRVESHLGECGECDLLFRQANGVSNLMDRWEGIEPEGDFVAAFWKEVSEGDAKRGEGILDFFRNLKLGWQFAAAVAVILIVSIVSLNVFEPDKANVVFTSEDKYDEELLIRLDRAVSSETAESLKIYGPWDEKI